MASTASRSPWTTLKTPSGTPASLSISARCTLADGSFSDGLSTNVLPHARATGNIHIGTIAGKLNGVIPAQTPIGSSRRMAVHTAPDGRRMCALEQVRRATRKLDHLDAALHLTHCVEKHLPVFLTDHSSERLLVALDELAESCQDARTAHRRRGTPRGKRRRCGGDGRIDVGRVCKWHNAHNAAGCRVGDVAEPNALRCGWTSIDPQRNRCER